MTQQFYKLTLSEAIAHYNQGDITAKGLVHFYILIKGKPGWKIKLAHKEVCAELGISKAAFYNAISRLKVEGSINWEAPKGVRVSINASVCECGQQSTIMDSESTIMDSESTIMDSESTIVDSEASKPASSKASSDPSDSYQIFSKSLPDSAREKFLNFVREKIKDFPKPINDIEGWLAGKNQAGQDRFRVYYEMFQSEVGEGVAPSADWESHPKWRRALAAMRTGVPRFIVLGEPGCSDIDKPTRQAMADYAEAHNLIWGEES